MQFWQILLRLKVQMRKSLLICINSKVSSNNFLNIFPERRDEVSCHLGVIGWQVFWDLIGRNLLLLCGYPILILELNWDPLQIPVSKCFLVCRLDFDKILEIEPIFHDTMSDRLVPDICPSSPRPWQVCLQVGRIQWKIYSVPLACSTSVLELAESIHTEQGYHHHGLDHQWFQEVTFGENNEVQPEIKLNRLRYPAKFCDRIKDFAWIFYFIIIFFPKKEEILTSQQKVKISLKLSLQIKRYRGSHIRLYTLVLIEPH